MYNKSFVFAMLLVVLGAPALADDGLGADFLMSKTTIDNSASSAKKSRWSSKRSKSIAQAKTVAERPANTVEFPTQILKTGVTLTEARLSPNGLQLADNIGLSPILTRIQSLRERADETNDISSLDRLAAKQDLLDTVQSARLTVQRAALEIDFTSAAIAAERQVYKELLESFKSDRDKAVARTNALAFISNGVLWAVCEAFVIPTYKHPIYNIPAGITGIPAGVVPSIASMYTFKLMNGKKKTSELEPNMLAKLFNYSANPEIEYPKSVWNFLNQVPADSPEGKKRLEQMVDRWIVDANMSDFTDRQSKKQLDVLTASVSHRKALTIGVLIARCAMLDQLEAEVCKMKRMLLELNMVVSGDKRVIASNN